MTKLSQIQKDLLITACDTDDGFIDAPKESQARTVASLIKQGFAMSIPKGDGPSRLMITNAGRTAVDRPPTEERVSSQADETNDTPTAPERSSSAKGKLASLVALLQRPEGATIREMCEATAWQAHSVRGAIAGSLKKKHGLTITSTKDGQERTYRAATQQGVADVA